MNARQSPGILREKVGKSLLKRLIYKAKVIN